MRDRALGRRFAPGDVPFALFLAAYAVLSVLQLPFDFRDLCYLFSLEQGRWVTQEWVHPIYVPVLDLLRTALGYVGYNGPMLVPVELLNVAASITAFALLYRLARRAPDASIAAFIALAATALSMGFWLATVRPTPYALAFLCQTICLSLLLSQPPVSVHRYALAGVLAGVGAGFHAAVMALALVAVACAFCEPDPARSRQGVMSRVLAFAVGLFASMAACWTIFVRYRSIGVDYFRNLDAWSTLLAIVQLPSSSLYANPSVFDQLAGFVSTMRWQAAAIVLAGFVIGVTVAVSRRTEAPSLLLHRLTIAMWVNFAAITVFLLINSSRNGFIFASLTLVPVLLAVHVRQSPSRLALLLVCTVPFSIINVADMLASPQGKRDPLLIEARYLSELLGSRDLLLTPGTPFPEILYLSHLNILELSLGSSSHPSPEVPIVHPSAALHARLAWWRAQGRHVFYALGDESTDFSGDVSGAEKARQIFWRPEIVAAERAPRLRAVRSALEASGIELRDDVTSPNGNRYAEIWPDESSTALAAPPAAAVAPAANELHTLFQQSATDAAFSAQRAAYLAAFAAAVPADPWQTCDVMQLVCQGKPRRGREIIACQQSTECQALSGMATDQPADMVAAADTTRAEAAGCFWGALSSEAEERTVSGYLEEWLRSNDLGHLADWGFRGAQESAELNLSLKSGSLTLTWRLEKSCEPGPVTVKHADGISPPSPAQLQRLVSRLPMPTVRAGSAPSH